METYAFITVFSPLLGAILVGLIMGRHHNEHLAEGITCFFMGLSAIMAGLVIYGVCFQGVRLDFPLLTWIDVGSFQANWGLMVDPLTAVMMGVVTVVSLMVHIYSIGYMHEDKSIPRFMAYLSLFTFFMLSLVTAPNLIQVFFGWEGVGVASYLLIGFWYDRPSAGSAAMKAFLVNRVGDIGLALGIFATFILFDSVTFSTIFPAVGNVIGDSLDLPFLGDTHGLTLICFLLFIGAMGKSAQLGLHVWLPDAMEGPTPVSALIHAATMVTAGVFLMARISPMLEYAPFVRDVILFVGGSTAFFAATVACTQTDIKRVIAYSTCSQLGYMFASIGVSAYGAAIFHLATHAFFKALLFLSAGSVIHAVSGSQDLREMGGLWRLIPFTYAVMWIGSLALAGIPYFAGYYSKDAILEGLWAAGSPLAHYAFIMGIIAAFLTAFYSWRLLLMAFHGSFRGNEAVLSRVHESPPWMTIPLCVLAMGAIFAGYLGADYFIGDARLAFWGPAIFVAPEHRDLFEKMHHLPHLVELAPLIVGVLGISLAILFYGFLKQIPAFLAQQFQFFYKFLLNKWYVDELYEALFIHPAWVIGGFLWQKGDAGVIDRYGPDGVAALTQRQSLRCSHLQTGYLYHYAFAMLLGVLTMLMWIF